jgi:predicted MFS family arabinose efflux permease
MMILAIGGLYGFAGEGLDRLWEAHFLTNFQFPAIGSLNPVAWFGVFNVSAMLLSAVSVSIAVRRARSIESRGAARALSVLYALFVVTMIVMGLALSFWMALAAFWAMVLVTSANRPIYEVWLNQNVKSEVRATLLSMSSQIAALGGMLGGVALGALANAFTTRSAMVAIGLVVVPALALFARAGRRGAHRPSNLEVEVAQT